MLYEAHGIKKFVVVCGYTDLRKGIPGLSRHSTFDIGTVYQRGQTTVNLGTLYSEEEKLA